MKRFLDFIDWMVTCIQPIENRWFNNHKIELVTLFRRKLLRISWRESNHINRHYYIHKDHAYYRNIGDRQYYAIRSDEIPKDLLEYAEKTLSAYFTHVIRTRTVHTTT